ncbi:CRISPR-associated helicase Cas3' [Actinosynnema sp. NPDC050436]|uniref:CRISPR-associated helicase Cas3' n=1 Tax=Actinosynnema sp. NPDC050436 TaxID=3155659 RepID=UPI0033E60873
MGSPPVWGAWGKASGTRPPHPLVCHVVDTAAVAELVMPGLLGPVCLAELRASFSVLDDPDTWIALLCGLHDLGKYGAGFQGQRVDLAVERLGGEAAADLAYLARPKGVPRVDTPHGTVTALHLRDMLARWGMPSSSAEMISCALGGHHGYFPARGEVDQAGTEVNDHGGQRWATWRNDLVKDLVRAFGLSEPEPSRWAGVRIGVETAVALAALTTVSDWIASDTSNYTSPGEPFDLGDYIAQARKRAGGAVVTAGMRSWKAPVDTSFDALFAGLSEVWPVQVTTASLVAGRSEPTMLVVEAPTGEGKTNAALQAAATLVGRLELTGVYVAMPTKATSRQFRGEFEKLLKHVGDDSTVKLVYSEVQASLEEPAVEPSDVGQDDQQDSDVAAREWFTRKKSLLAALGVGTLDQAAKSVVRSGHQFVRLAGLSSKVVVFDEVHAYDTQMSALLDRLLMWLGRLGASVVLLSATLPSRRHHELVTAWQAGVLGCPPSAVPAGEEGIAYPRVTVAGRGPARTVPVGVSKLNTGRLVVLHKIVPDEHVADWLVDRARDGRAVAVVHNLRGRAKATFEAVREAVRDLPSHRRPEVVLLHGQLTNAERTRREADVRRWFGRDGERCPAIVVGTQVLEQSLDLDFDTMVTDLAPIDLLIQRAGRVHRHSRAGRGDLVLGITGVTDTPAGPTFPQYLHSVYSRYILLRTWAVVRNKNLIRCPDEVSELVDAVYGPAGAVACPDGWQALWQASAAAHQRDINKQKDQAHQWYVPMPMAVERLNELTDIPAHVKNLRSGGKWRDGRT